MRKTILNILLIIFTISLYLGIIDIGENMARTQNSLNLQSVNSCVILELKSHKKTEKELFNILDKCAQNQRSLGITGDIFVIKQNNKQLFWDSSKAFKIDSDNPSFMTEDSVCGLFSDINSCIKAVDIMVNKEPIGTLEWKFDNSTEYIDYKYLEDTTGEKSEMLIINDSKFIVGQGAQQDEIEKNFFLIFIILGAGLIAILSVINF